MTKKQKIILDTVDGINYQPQLVKQDIFHQQYLPHLFLKNSWLQATHMYCTPPETSQVTFSPLEFGSRELTIPKRSRLESPGIYQDLPIYIYILPNPRDSYSHHHHRPLTTQPWNHPTGDLETLLQMLRVQWGLRGEDFLSWIFLEFGVFGGKNERSPKKGRKVWTVDFRGVNGV